MKTFSAAAAAALLTAVLLPGTASAAEPAHLAYTSAKFEKYSAKAKAVTYNAELVKAGAHVTVLSIPTIDGKTTVGIRVKGLVANRVYGTHVHVKKCGALPADAGPHYQNVADPVQPSVDPKYANPQNEIWLDLTTDERGNAYTTATVAWQFTERHAQSVVLHAEKTSSHEGHAGTAGARLACANVDF
ncbi:hypothetical protein Lesp02_36130 [Lentzea sp. NBRC 105346]|uniref:superoxide dismutase family protein n=1 Tax=Lentzea sp. NBRC 105346 TaxID=3032205 RepID=UPI0024A3265E|nr:superoxide dismutase family protein [Lentzea sp. NBRC 105346]GLZ31425.1 hypothetical protein Lesp02_36130 [Lentzea sp. NBRC 105346]